MQFINCIVNGSLDTGMWMYISKPIYPKKISNFSILCDVFGGVKTYAYQNNDNFSPLSLQEIKFDQLQQCVGHNINTFNGN